MMCFCVSDAARASLDAYIRALIKSLISASDDQIKGVPLHYN